MRDYYALGFGDFLDITNGCTDVPGLIEVDAGTLEAAVDTFATAMCAFYELEAEMRQAALPLLDKIISAHSSKIIPRVLASTIGTVHSDGHTEGRHGGMAMVEEIKNRDTGNSASAPVRHRLAESQVEGSRLGVSVDPAHAVRHIWAA
jgi:hypothetical protein